MADRLAIPDPDLRALVLGRTVVAFAPRHAVDLNDELELVGSGPRPPDQLTLDHRDLADGGPVKGTVVGLVVGLQPAASLAGEGGRRHHVLADVPDGDVAILRVFIDAGPALSDADFEERRTAVEAMFR